jgi:diguanylate cyclase
MKRDESKEKVLYYHSLAVIEMGKRDIPLTPKNYAVWYEYVRENDQDIMARIRELDKQKSQYNQDDNEALYRCYSGKESLDESTDELKLFIHKLIGELSEKIKEEGIGLTNFTDTLEETLNRIGLVNNANELKALVVSLTLNVKKQIERNVELEKTLSSTTSQVDQLKGKIERISRDRLTDPLTGVGNRRSFDQRIKQCFRALHEDEEPFSLLLLDIDHFKQFNDRYGHAIGDKVLKYFARISEKVVRGADQIFRVGGEEFAILLPKTPYYGALTVAENIRKEVRKHRLVDKERRLDRVTVSVGVSTADFEDTTESLFERADRALYNAKRSGRDQVIGEDTLCGDLSE